MGGGKPGTVDENVAKLVVCRNGETSVEGPRKCDHESTLFSPNRVDFPAPVPMKRRGTLLVVQGNYNCPVFPRRYGVV